jgi:hypothetical protein
MQTKTKRPEMMLWLSDARGQYIPRDFANSFADRAKAVPDIDPIDWEILETGPDHEWYWDAWETVCNTAAVIDENGTRYFIYQDGDCWLVPEGMEWSDREDGFVWPDEESDEED